MGGLRPPTRWLLKTHISAILLFVRRRDQKPHGPIVYRLGHILLKDGSRVRLPVGSQKRELVRALEKARISKQKQVIIWLAFVVV